MPSGVALSPEMLDHSFPRSAGCLRAVSISLGTLQAGMETKDYVVVLTTATEQFVEAFSWTAVASYGDLQIIYSLLVQWLLQPSASIKLIRTTEINPKILHPVPVGAGTGPMIDVWRDEIGRLLHLHEAIGLQGYCIGVACIHAFSGGLLGSYEAPVPPVHFPLVGPTEASTLLDLETWAIPADIHNQCVTYSEAKKNLFLLGGDVATTPVGSHYKVTFEGAPRSWVLDSNFVEVPDRFVAQLPGLCGYPLDVVRYVLICGAFPPRTCRI